MSRVYVDWCEFYPWPFITQQKEIDKLVIEERAYLEKSEPERAKFEGREQMSSLELGAKAASRHHRTHRFVMDDETLKEFNSKFDEIYNFIKLLKSMKEDGDEVYIPYVGNVKLEVKA